MLNFKDEGCRPTKGSKYSAAVDLYASEDVEIGAGETAIIGLGVTIDQGFIKNYMHMNIDAGGRVEEGYKEAEYEDFMKSHYLQLEPRSSLRAKGLSAGTGIIDLDYPDEIKLILHNPLQVENIGTYYAMADVCLETDGEPYKINKGDKIAQILLKEHKTYLLGVETEEERVGGIGSTDNGK